MDLNPLVAMRGGTCREVPLNMTTNDEFFLSRKDVWNGEIIFTESAPHPFPG
jgi:hypothetical protein